MNFLNTQTHLKYMNIFEKFMIFLETMNFVKFHDFSSIFIFGFNMSKNRPHYFWTAVWASELLDRST